MRIEETFRDAKSLLAMRVILNRVSHSLLKEGLVLLLFASWLFLAKLGSQAIKSQVLLQSVLNMAEKGYYSPITLGRLWLYACAIKAFIELIEWQELMGGLEMGQGSISIYPDLTMFHRDFWRFFPIDITIMKTRRRLSCFTIS